MAITDAYADITKYHSIFPAKTSAAEDAEITLQLLAMSRVLERDRLGRYLTKDAVATVRRYDATPRRTLNIEDIADIAGMTVKLDVNNDGVAETTLTLTTDYELLPRNALTGPEPQPYTQLYLPERGTRYFWPGLVEVSAIHGFPAIPEGLKQGICQLVAILRLESPRATTRINEGIAAVVGTSPEARDVVDMLTDAYAKPAWIYS